MIKNKVILESFLFLFIALLFIVFPFSVYGDVTDVLRPVSDGSNDSVEWINEADDTCDTVSCAPHVDEYDGAVCTNSDGDLSYIESSTNGASQTFNVDISSIPDNSTIDQIDLTFCYMEGQGGQSNALSTTMCIDEVCSNSPDSLLPGADYVESTQTFSGLEIVKDSGTGVQIGASIVGTTGRLARVSQISSVISYTPYDPGNGGGNGGGSVSGGGGVAPSIVSFEGLAYPGSEIEILRKSHNEDVYRNVPTVSYVVLDDGSFRLVHEALLSREYFFTIRAIDKDGRKTGILSFGINLQEGNLIVEDIFFPPTVGFVEGIVKKGDEVEIVGYASPNNTVELSIGGNVLGTTFSENDGSYFFATSTRHFDNGNYFVNAQQIDSEGRTSDLSISNVFKVTDLAYPEADFTNDGTVDISDWSIFLFRWSSLDADLHSKIDLDSSGIVDIFDLSIFLKAIKL